MAKTYITTPKAGVLSTLGAGLLLIAAVVGFIVAMNCSNEKVDGGYAAFGKVIEGMEVVNKIAETRTDYSDRPLADQVM